MATQKGRTRDSQRQKVYNAEMATLDKREGVTPRYGIALPTVQDVEAYTDHLTSSAWWKRRTASGSVTVADGRGRRKAASHGGKISIPRWARTEGVVLHEMAHEMARYPKPWLLGVDETWDGTWRLWADDRDLAAKRGTWPGYFSSYNGFASHGRLFARCFLDLVKHRMGKDAHDVLKASFRDHGVKFTRRRPPMSEEQRAAAAARLAAARPRA